MFCSKCGKELEIGSLFCSNCGSKVNIITETEEVIMSTENANGIEPEIEETIAEVEIQDAIENGNEITQTDSQKKDTYDDGNKSFIDSFKNDIKNSNSIKYIKDKCAKIDVSEIKSKVSDSAKSITSKSAGIKKQKIVISVAVIIIALVVIVVAHIHKCEECDKVYFGNKYEISFWGQREEVCKDCYNDFYLW